MRSRKSTPKDLMTILVGLLAVALFMLAGLPTAQGERVDLVAPQSSEETAATGTVTVDVIDFRFVDRATGTPVTKVAPGTTVKWEFLEGVHSSTEGVSAVVLSTPAAWDSGMITPSSSPNTFSKTFDSEGVFAYYCKLHQEDMKATVIVA